MLLSQIDGQKQAVTLLQNSLQREKISHAYIFNGPKGTGKRTAAMAFARAFFCKEQRGIGCETCVSCRKLQNRNHSSLFEIEPTGSTIKIEQIRELKWKFSYRQDEAEPQLYVIYEAEKMTIQAANSLLKFLEEPQAQVVAILISENGQAILPTLRSRSQWVPFVPTPPLEMEKILEADGYPLSLVRPAVRLHSGLESARETVQSNEFAEIRSVVIQLMKECLNDQASASIAAQQKLFKSDLHIHIETVLDLIVLWLKDMIFIQCGQENRAVFMDHVDWMAQYAKQKPASHWINDMDRVVQTRKRLRLHVQPQLALEQAMFQIKGG